jgi:hypothetical protein
MGARLRLRADFDTSGFSAQNQVILMALKKYGMILADNGSAIYISGAPDSRWNNPDLHLLDMVIAADFDVVTTGPTYTNSDVPTSANPTISSFSANPTHVAKGKPSVLSWSVGDAITNIISPKVGPLRGTSVTVHPAATTTYTLYSNNQYGRTTASVTVSVP